MWGKSRGSAAVMYLILKETADQLITTAKAMTPMNSLISGLNGEGGGTNEGVGATTGIVDMCGALNQLTMEQVAVVQALNISGQCLANVSIADVMNVGLKG